MRTPGPSFFDPCPVHVVTTYGLLVGLEREGVIDSADAVLDSMRGKGPLPLLTPEAGRPGLRRTLIDRPHRDEEGEDTTWNPPGMG